MNLRDFNQVLFEQYNLLENVKELSSPLLVSSNNEYLNNMKNSSHRIFYIGQETNGWVNDYNNDSKIDVNLLEDIYLEVLKRKNNREFFRFLNNFSSMPYDNVVWTNVLLAGKKYGVGYPKITDKLQELSLENLIFLYKYFKPDITLFVSGPNNPYYEIVKSFLEAINSKIDNYPTITNPVINNKEKNIFWTYHPNYLNRAHLKEKVLNIIKTSN